ncbi:hypothetical protein ACP70R_012159 [Stipagrostis hirtigluma subsp. patula]
MALVLGWWMGTGVLRPGLSFCSPDLAGVRSVGRARCCFLQIYGDDLFHLGCSLCGGSRAGRRRAKRTAGRGLFPILAAALRRLCAGLAAVALQGWRCFRLQLCFWSSISSASSGILEVHGGGGLSSGVGGLQI